MFLIVRVSGLITKLHPPRGALSVRAVSAAPASATGAGVVSRTALEGGEGEGMAIGQASGRQVEVGVQSSTGRPKPRVV